MAHLYIYILVKWSSILISSWRLVWVQILFIKYIYVENEMKWTGRKFRLCLFYTYIFFTTYIVILFLTDFFFHIIHKGSLSVMSSVCTQRISVLIKRKYQENFFFLWNIISFYPFFCHWHIYSTKQIAMTLWIIIPYALPDQILYRINLDKLLSTYTQSIPIMVKIFFCSFFHTHITYSILILLLILKHIIFKNNIPIGGHLILLYIEKFHSIHFYYYLNDDTHIHNKWKVLSLLKWK